MGDSGHLECEEFWWQWQLRYIHINGNDNWDIFTLFTFWSWSRSLQGKHSHILGTSQGGNDTTLQITGGLGAGEGAEEDIGAGAEESAGTGAK